MANYGISYQGSKNAIAEYIVRQLPNANTFVDLFCGGCSITHCAMLSGKYNNFIINDINKDMPQFFVDCIKGKYNTKTCTEWISKEEFQKRKDSDIYIRTCWSFGNDGRTYMYGESIEPYKKALHYAIFFNDYSLGTKLGFDFSPLENVKGIIEKKNKLKELVLHNMKNIEKKVAIIIVILGAT